MAIVVNFRKAAIIFFWYVAINGKKEGVSIKGGDFDAYFDAKEHWTQDKINEAKTSHSTSKNITLAVRHKRPMMKA